MKLFKKWLTCLLCLTFVTSLALSFVVLPTQAAEANGEVSYEETFENYKGFEGKTLFNSGIWFAESKANGSVQDNAQPTISNGVLKVVKGTSAQVVWQNIEGFTFDATKTYTIKLDIKITSFGDDTHAQAREFYFAPGGWFNQIELKSSAAANKVIRTGGTYCGNVNQEYKLNTVYGVEIVWVPATGTMTTTLKNGETIVSTGSRSGNDYKNANSYFSNWVFRCEDGAFEMDNFSFTDGTNTYTEDFSSSMESGYLASNGYWRKADMMRPSGSAPALENGKLVFETKENAEFNWYELTTHRADKAYTFEFDFKVTNVGTGYEWSAAACSRALYVSFGGWWTFMEIPVSDGRLRVGDTYQNFDAKVFENKNLHAKLVLEGGTVYCYLYDEEGKCFISGSRTNSAFASGQDQYVPHFALRCEDGAVEIDNFKFYSKTFTKTNSKELAIESGKYANYSATVTYDGEEKVSLRLNGTEFFSISPETSLAVAGSTVKGVYEAGDYTINAMVNPSQKMVMVEVVLPDGGILRRGSYSVLPSNATSYTIDTYTYLAEAVKNVTVTYADATSNEYQLIEEMPVGTGFSANVYNLVTSFDDPATTRNFAFTALYSFTDGEAMAVKYRAKGSTKWTVVRAIRESELVNLAEEYFKVDVTGLQPNTEYEYKIGKLNSANEEDDWSKMYTFKTATGNEEEFTFIATGDTQGITWNGRTGSTKGFMFSQTAYNEAFEEISNAAFMLHTGDVVENGGDAEQWNMFFKSLGEWGATIPFFATIGNHDVVDLGDSGRNLYYDLHFNHPNNGGTKVLDKNYTSMITDGWLQALAQRADETVYSFNYGDAHFVVLASGRYHGQDEYLLQAQRAWLDADLKANACAKWKVVLVHEPVYHRLGGAESRPWLYDVIEENGVDLVIQGHSHLVTRSYPMKNGQIVTKTNVDSIKQGVGTVYTTIGSTAYNHDSLGNPNVEEMMFIATPDAEQPTYTSVSVKGDKLVMTVKQINGLIVDQFEITADTTRPDHQGETTTTGAKDPTCATEGYTGDTVCTTCGKVIELGQAIPATNEHVYENEVATEEYLAAGATCTQKASYYKSCDCGTHGTEVFYYGETLDHDWDDGHVKQPPTATEEGEMEYTCGDCGETKIEKIPVVEESETPSVSEMDPPTTVSCGSSAGQSGNFIFLLGAIVAVFFVRVIQKRKA